MLQNFRRLTMVALLALSLKAKGQAPPAPASAANKPAESKGVESKAATWYGGFTHGRFLPNGIYGVRSIYPFWAFRFGHPFMGQGLEWSLHHINSDGVTFYTGSISLTFPSELESWKFIPYLGLDTSYYHGHTNVHELPFSTSVGFHLGVAPVLDINSLLSLRFDFKFNFNPGRSLNVGAGLQFNL